MKRKLLNITHHLSSGCCMWSGIEDVYATKTNQTIPGAFLFALSSFGETSFLSFKKAENRTYMLSVADGRTRNTYDSIKDILGLTYQISEGRTLAYALKSVKKEIDLGNPVILGPLDMFHLPYLKMYHKYHIPIHYVLMAGYDEEKNCVLVYDCDREEIQELPQCDLIKAWQIEKNAVGDKNGFIRFHLSNESPDKYQLTEICLRNKAKRQLYSKPDFVGVKAYFKIAEIFPAWKNRMSVDEYRNAVASLTEYLGRVPKLPNEIVGIPDKDDICYDGNYKRLGDILIQLGEEYERSDWKQAGNIFSQCGSSIEEITVRIIRFYCLNEDCLSDLPDMFLNIGLLAKQAYEKFN